MKHNCGRYQAPCMHFGSGRFGFLEEHTNTSRNAALSRRWNMPFGGVACEKRAAGRVWTVYDTVLCILKTG